MASPCCFPFLHGVYHGHIRALFCAPSAGGGHPYSAAFAPRWVCSPGPGRDGTLAVSDKPEAEAFLAPWWDPYLPLSSSRPRLLPRPRPGPPPSAPGAPARRPSSHRRPPLRAVAARGISGLVVRPRKGGCRPPRARLSGTTTPTEQRAAFPAPAASRPLAEGPPAAAGEGRKDGGRGRGQRQGRRAAARVAAPVPHPGHHEELPRGVQHQPGSPGAHGQGHGEAGRAGSSAVGVGPPGTVAPRPDPTLRVRRAAGSPPRPARRRLPFSGSRVRASCRGPPPLPPSLGARARAPVPAIPPSLGSAHDSRPASRAAPALPRAGVPGPGRGRAWPLFPPHVAGLTARSLRFPRFRLVSWLGGPTCSNGPLRGPGRRPRGPAGFREEGPALPPTHPLPASPRRAVPGPERKQFHEP